MILNNKNNADQINNTNTVTSVGIVNNNTNNNNIMDLNKINLDNGVNPVSKNMLKVSTLNNVLKFNLTTIIPGDAVIKDYNLTLFNNNRIVNTGLNINTNHTLLDIYPDLKLKGNVFYEKFNNTYEILIDNNIKPNSVTEAIINIKNLTSTTFNTPEDVINHLIGEINNLKTQLTFLEIKVNAE